MIGNDIVDLQLAKTQSNWQRKGFLEKQFTSSEQEKIALSKNPFQLVWLFWTMKEAAYKCHTQQYQKRFFNPKKIQCKIESETKGSATINNQKYILIYCLSGNYIHSVAFLNSSLKMECNSFFAEDNSKLSQKINKKIASFFSGEITIKKNSLGVPYLYENGKIAPFSISKSHHGNYGAFAIEKDL